MSYQDLLNREPCKRIKPPKAPASTRPDRESSILDGGLQDGSIYMVCISASGQISILEGHRWESRVGVMNQRLYDWANDMNKGKGLTGAYHHPLISAPCGVTPKLLFRFVYITEHKPGIWKFQTVPYVNDCFAIVPVTYYFRHEYRVHEDLSYREFTFLTPRYQSCINPLS